MDVQRYSGIRRYAGMILVRFLCLIGIFGNLLYLLEDATRTVNALSLAFLVLNVLAIVMRRGDLLL
jgi:hypothetical protein